MHLLPWLLLALVVGLARGGSDSVDALVCGSRDEATRLLHLACTESFPATHLFDVGNGVSVASDDDDLEYERARVAAYAEWVGVLRPSYGSTASNTATAHMWFNEEATLLASDRLTLWYQAGTAPVSSPCTPLLNATTVEGFVARQLRMLPIVHQMIMERMLFDQRATCPGINERLMFDLATHKSKCICQQDKVCGVAGTHFNTLLTTVLVIACIVVAVTVAVMLYTSVQALRETAKNSALTLLPTTATTMKRWANN